MTATGVVLGLDFGTTNYKAGIYNCDGQLLGLGSVAPCYDTTDDGRVELPVAQMLNLVREAIALAAQEAGISTAEICGVGYSTQANTFVLLDDEDQPLTPFVVWTDHREKKFPLPYQDLADTPEFLNRVGFNRIAPGMMVANIAWFQRQQPEIWRRTRSVLTLPDYFVYQLTGQKIGDSGSGALLGLWDLQNNKWWDEALKFGGICEDLLPELVYPGTIAGTTNRNESRELLGLPEGIPVVVGSLDHHVAAIGAGAGKKAPFSISTGTVLAATCLDERYKVDPNCCLGSGMNGKGYYRLAWHNHGTRALNWYRDRFTPNLSVAELLEQAGRIEQPVDLPRVTLCPWETSQIPMFDDEHYQSDDHGFYTLAILKSMSDLLRDMLMNLQPDLVPQGIVVTGGGARCDLWMKMIANTLQAPVYRSASEQAGCLGAAVLAAVGAGWYPAIDEASTAMVEINDCIYPDQSDVDRVARLI